MSQLNDIHTYVCSVCFLCFFFKIRDTLFCTIKGRVYKAWFNRKPNIHFGQKTRIINKPIIDVRLGSNLVVGKNVTLNSKNKGYHINMFGPVKLFANGNPAEIMIGDNTRIHGTCIHALESVRIGKNCLIAANCHIVDSHGHDLSFPNVEDRIHTEGKTAPVIVEDNVWIGANSFIMPGVRIGYGAVIGANSVVTKDIPPMSVAGGNPAHIIKRHSEKSLQNNALQKPEKMSLKKMQAVA